jgi:hypothetical protein
MIRILTFLWLIFSLLSMSGQNWATAKVWTHKESGQLTRIKLISSGQEQPLFLLPRQAYKNGVTAWDWLSEEGGILRIFGPSAPDSFVLIAGQTKWRAFRDTACWWIVRGADSLRLRQAQAEQAWLVEKLLRPLPGTLTIPPPIRLAAVRRHATKKNRFDIDLTGNLEAVPSIMIEMGIILALLQAQP